MIVLDSSFLIAYKVKNDQLHNNALDVAKKLKTGEYGRGIISDYIFGELLRKIRFVKMDDKLLNDSRQISKIQKKQ